MGDFHTIDEAKRVHERARAVSFDFVMQGVEPGLTFCHTLLAKFD
jgi:hypothetical protein